MFIIIMIANIFEKDRRLSAPIPFSAPRLHFSTLKYAIYGMSLQNKVLSALRAWKGRLFDFLVKAVKFLSREELSQRHFQPIAKYFDCCDRYLSAAFIK